MIASPNGFAGVYDEPAAPAGSGVARELLRCAVERAGGTPIGVDLGGGRLNSEAVDLDGVHAHTTSPFEAHADATDPREEVDEPERRGQRRLELREERRNEADGGSQ